MKYCYENSEGKRLWTNEIYPPEHASGWMLVDNPQPKSITIDLEHGEIECDETVFPLSSPIAFDLISKAWLRAGWDTKYVYGFTWMGRPVIQLPEDLIRIQEVIWEVKPDIIIETGVAHGGGLVFYASLLKAINKQPWCVIGIDKEIREANRIAIDSHTLRPYISLLEGDSTSETIIKTIKRMIQPNKKVMVCLDSCHTKDHVLRELELYSKFVSVDSYIVAMDGIMKDLVGAPRSQPDWDWNNPQSAVEEFLKGHPEFELVEPKKPFNEGSITKPVTYWPKAFLRRIK